MAEYDDLLNNDSFYKDMEHDLVQAKMQSKLLQLKVHLLENENSALLHELQFYKTHSEHYAAHKPKSICIYDAFWKNDWFINFSESDLHCAKGGIMMTTNIDFDKEAFDFTRDNALQLRDYLNGLYGIFP